MIEKFACPQFLSPDSLLITEMPCFSPSQNLFAVLAKAARGSTLDHDSDASPAARNIFICYLAATSLCLVGVERSLQNLNQKQSIPLGNVA